MRGKRNIRLDIDRVVYDIELERKVTIIKGRSATGKTTFVDAINIWLARGSSTGVKIFSNAKVLTIDNRNWKDVLKRNKGCIIVSDESFKFFSTIDFADAVNKSDNYFLLISRLGTIKYLTYSIDSIYEFVGNKVGSVILNRLYRRYIDNQEKTKPDICITEDKKAGFNTYSKLLVGCTTKSAGGKDSVYDCVIDAMFNNYVRVCAIVDGAAFGCCIGRFDKILNRITMVAPESFEYLLLNTSKIFPLVEEEVVNTHNYCEYSEDIVSYERYYTKLLKEVLYSRFRLSYDKRYLPKIFENNETYEEIKGMLSQIDFD